MFDTDGHVVLDILPIRSNYGGRGASQQVKPARGHAIATTTCLTTNVHIFHALKIHTQQA